MSTLKDIDNIELFSIKNKFDESGFMEKLEN